MEVFPEISPPTKPIISTHQTHKSRTTESRKHTPFEWTPSASKQSYFWQGCYLYPSAAPKKNTLPMTLARNASHPYLPGSGSASSGMRARRIQA